MNVVVRVSAGTRDSENRVSIQVELNGCEFYTFHGIKSSFKENFRNSKLINESPEHGKLELNIQQEVSLRELLDVCLATSYNLFLNGVEVTPNLGVEHAEEMDTQLSLPFASLLAMANNSQLETVAPAVSLKHNRL